MTDKDARAADIADQLLAAAKARGADAADAVAFSGETLSASARNKALEHVERDEFLEFGLRVLLSDGAGGARQATVSASDAAPEVIERLAETALAMAREAPADPYAALALETVDDHTARAVAAGLGLTDGAAAPAAETLLEDALALEAAAAAVDGVSQVESAGASWRRSRTHLATSAGFAGGYDASFYSMGVSAVAGRAGEAGGMERDYAFTSARRRDDLRAVEAVGREAGSRAARRRNPRSAKTAKVPVVFEERVAASFATALLSAANGASVARGSSFLSEKMGARLLPESFNLVDDPTRAGGLGAKPFDAEGVMVAPKRVIADGRLSCWLLDTAAALQLGLASNGSASRGAGGAPRPASSTAWLSAGETSVEALIADIESGFFVTEMMGGGVNAVTGEYSRGASGFWIEKGAIAYPVSELTVAGDFLEMIADLEAADDLSFERRVNAPTLRVASAMVAANG